MGKPLLPLLLGLSILVGFLQALTCHQCPLLNSKGKCHKAQGFCEAAGDQQCVLRIISTGGENLFGIQDCADRCINQTIHYRDVTMKFKCCDSQSFCNRI
ncbi:secreted seminal-vesicle Ly-6 protein 1-like [Nannospalax galili]|uniref:secreted seminal-vesicle Ly-6 protein 1-like n=1 Tax=Nannospalax galili TaxID=1026970 RepID=UPI000819E74D|nr:secreted seminal-vesicle Ly-6 protein 1-like [Nannospalax galili]